MFWFALVLLIIESANAKVISQEDSNNDPVFIFLGKLLRSINENYPETNDVAIVKFLSSGEPSWKIEKTIESVLQSIPDSMPFHMSPNNQIVEFRNLRPACITIIVSDISSGATLLARALNLRLSEFYSNDNKFVFVAIGMKVLRTLDVFGFFVALRIVNVIAIGEFDGLFLTLTYHPFSRPIDSLVTYTDEKETSVDLVFPDKLRNLYGFTYKVLVYENYRALLKNHYFHGPEIYFMAEVAKRQNANLEPVEITSKLGNVRDEILRIVMKTNSADVSINTEITVKSTDRHRLFKSINTFESEGFCAILPRPGINSRFDFMFRPFDLKTWIGVLLSLASFVTVWKLLNQRSTYPTNTCRFFFFGFISGFLKQSIPFRNNRPMQKGLLILTVAFTSVLSCFYETFFIASLASLNYKAHLKTVDDMINYNFSYFAPRLLQFSIRHSDFFQRIQANILGYDEDSLKNYNISYKEAAARNYGLIIFCSQVESFLDTESENGNVRDYYYKLDQELYTFFLEFPTAEVTSLHQRLQEFSMRMFENGLKSFWKSIVFRSKAADSKIKNSYLLLHDLVPAFVLLAIGSLTSFLILIIEICFHKKRRQKASTIMKNLQTRLRRFCRKK